jgi:protein phosphatase
VLRAYGVTDKGRVRPTNEDCLAIDEHCGLCVVADGMGGHNAGEVAAQMAVEAVVAFIAGGRADQRVDWPFGFDESLSEAGNRLRTAVHLANQQILDRAVTSESYSGMGTTIVAALAADGRLSVAHVGDSRLYLKSRDRMRQMTHDDSWVATMLAQDPAIDAALFENHPMRNALTNVVGTRRRAVVHVAEEMLDGGELLLLSTDGVHGVLADHRLEALMADGDVRQAAASIVAAALARGSRDNCSALVA